MRKFKIEIDLEGDAFREEGGFFGVVNILNRLIQFMEFGPPLTKNHRLHDSNGNTCGRAWIEEA